MGNWIVVDNFGNKVAGPFKNKALAEGFAQGHSNWTVVYKG